MDDILKLSNAIFSLIGWTYIMFKAGGWAGDTLAKQWCKRRKDTKQQKAVDALYDAYQLGDIEAGTTVKLATKGGLTIMMYRTEK
ncbi:DUF4752 family protein [Serratia odorifera]|uniref:DUF4752 family protein n=1 Tax=Serratia odorifera TaxID=618 RepID=UPI003D2BFB50